MLYLEEPFKRLWMNKDPFTELESIDGEIFRSLEARKTLRFICRGKPYFLKFHKGVGWLEIIDNLLRFRRPVLGAQDEYKAIKKLEEINVDTMHISGFGKKGINPAHQKSFIITRELTDTISLEDLTLGWKQRPPAFLLKQRLIQQVAAISKNMHDNGINHRDYYICHFLLHIPVGKDSIDSDKLMLWLIDLHRAQIRNVTPKRWVIKDIASLWFSAMDIGLTQRDFYRFVCAYTNLPLRQAFVCYEWLWTKSQKKSNTMYERKQRKGDSI